MLSQSLCYANKNENQKEIGKKIYFTKTDTRNEKQQGKYCYPKTKQNKQQKKTLHSKQYAGLLTGEF